MCGLNPAPPLPDTATLPVVSRGQWHRKTGQLTRESHSSGMTEREVWRVSADFSSGGESAWAGVRTLINSCSFQLGCVCMCVCRAYVHSWLYVLCVSISQCQWWPDTRFNVLVREPDQGNTFMKLVKNTRQNISKLVKFLLRMFY